VSTETAVLLDRGGRGWETVSLMMGLRSRMQQQQLAVHAIDTKCL